VLEHDAAVVCAESSCNENIFLILKAVELHSRSGSHTNPARKEEGYKQDECVGYIEVVLEKSDNDHKGYGTQNLGNTLHDKVKLAAVVAFDGTVDSADEEVYCGNADSKDEGEACTARQTGENVLTGVGSAEDEERLLDTVAKLCVLVDIVLTVVNAESPIVAIHLLSIVIELGIAFLKHGAEVVILTVSFLINWNEVTLLIVNYLGLAAGADLGLVPNVGVGFVLLGFGTESGISNRINYLNAVLVLIPLYCFIFSSIEFNELHTDSVIGIKTEAIKFTGLAHVDFGNDLGFGHNNFTTYFFLNALIEVVGSLVDFLFLAAVPEVDARIIENGVSGEHETVITVSILYFVGGKDGSNKCEEKENEDDNSSSNGCFVSGEAMKRITEIGHGLCFELQ